MLLSCAKLPQVMSSACDKLLVYAYTRSKIFWSSLCSVTDVGFARLVMFLYTGEEFDGLMSLRMQMRRGVAHVLGEQATGHDHVCKNATESDECVRWIISARVHNVKGFFCSLLCSVTDGWVVMFHYQWTSVFECGWISAALTRINQCFNTNMTHFYQSPVRCRGILLVLTPELGLLIWNRRSQCVISSHLCRCGFVHVQQLRTILSWSLGRCVG